MHADNEMKLKFLAKSCNESFARVVTAAFVSQLDPTVDEITDVKTAVSEAVTNAIIHGYENELGFIELSGKLFGRTVQISVTDFGKGIEDTELAREPLFTTKPDSERSGMGFSVMENFMDGITVESKLNKGTTITLFKTFQDN